MELAVRAMNTKKAPRKAASSRVIGRLILKRLPLGVGRHAAGAAWVYAWPCSITLQVAGQERDRWEVRGSD